MNPIDLAGPALPELSLEWERGPSVEEAFGREWLLTNGVGGYASGTVGGCNTRKYHGLFIPNLVGRGRMVMLARMAETVELGGKRVRLDGEEHEEGAQSEGLACLRRFRLSGLLPEWEYEFGGARLRRRLLFVHAENTVYLRYEHLSGPALTLRLRPFPAFRSHDGPLYSLEQPAPVATLEGGRLELRANPSAPPLRMHLYASNVAPFIGLPETSRGLLYRVEQSRGYEHFEIQQSPGYFECPLKAGESISVGLTLSDWTMLERTPEEAFALEQERERRLLERAPEAAKRGTGARLVLAADQFVIEPVHRPTDETWARSTGLDTRSVIAGYPWFTDWGRDTMISLEGLTLSTGRKREAAAILRTFLHYIRDGLLPNLFPEGENEGLYHTADATLWMFHALHRFLEHTGEDELLRAAFPQLSSVVQHHLAGTRFNIGVDPDDGLLRQGAPGYQLTWMDAKVDGWVVTPRRGKAVELNALWFNALRLMGSWAERLGQDPRLYQNEAERVFGAFNRRFWNAERGCLFDVVDAETGGNDPAVRPNQVFAISLEHPVLRRDRWESVLGVVRDQLLTPVGLRTLSPEHPDFKPKYDGDLRARDAAYHQGTVWPWLLGHYVDATLKLNGDRQKARSLLAGLEEHLSQACVGQVSEIFDATPPHRARGCFAQAWSVAEFLRAWLKTA